MELRRQDRLAFVKLTYHGPSGSGRGTNLRALHEALRADKRGELSFAGGGSERTLRFEFAPLQPIRYREFDIRFEVVAASGTAPMATTRRLALLGADGVVFVADSSRARLNDTMASFREIAQHLAAQRMETISVPLLLQYNRRDVADALSLAELDEALNARKLLAALPAVATLGEGVLETFAAALLGAMGMLAQRNQALNLLGGRDAETWVADTVEGLFGRVSLATPPKPVVPPPEELQELEAEPTSVPIPVAQEPALPGRIFQDIATEPITRKLSVRMVEEALAAIAAGTRPARAADAPEQQPAVAATPAAELAAAPAPGPVAATPTPPPPPAAVAASASPTPPPAAGAATPPPPPAPQPPRAAAAAASPASALLEESARLTRERDLARAELERARSERGRVHERHEALRQAVSVARALADGIAPERPLHDLLARLSSVSAARSASLLTPAGGRVRVVAGLDAGGDPVADAPQAGQLVGALVAGASAPVRREASPGGALARALEEAGYSPAPVVVLPLRTGRGLHGVIVLYFDDPAAAALDEALLALLASVADAVALAIRR